MWIWVLLYDVEYETSDSFKAAWNFKPKLQELHKHLGDQVTWDDLKQLKFTGRTQDNWGAVYHLTRYKLGEKRCN